MGAEAARQGGGKKGGAGRVVPAGRGHVVILRQGGDFPAAGALGARHAAQRTLHSLVQGNVRG